MKKVAVILVLIVFVAQLCACQRNPDQNPINSKNDGVFESNIYQPADDDKNLPSNIHDTEVFYSTDGSIEFTMNIEQAVADMNMPVIEAVPYNITENDVKRIASALLGDTVFYERDKSSNPTYSKEQIRSNINRWSEYVNPQNMASLYIDPETDTSYDIELLKTFIEQLTGQYEMAPEENPDAICDWQFKKERHYNDLEIEIGGRKESDDVSVIYAYTELNDLEYVLAAATHNQGSYVLNNITIGLQSAFGLHWDKAIWRAQLCRTETPTETQVSEVTTKAADVISAMDIGDWTIKRTYVQTDYYGDVPEYSIVVDAVPELNGVQTIWNQSTESMTSEDTFAFNYPMSKIEMIFSPSGDLVYFDFASPIVIKEVVNPNVKMLDMESLIETGKQHLMLSDAKASYGLPGGAGLIEMYEEAFGEKIICSINISNIRLELGRIRKADSNKTFYYTPMLVFEGTADYFGQDSGILFLSSSDYYETVNLVLVNAVDGTIIEG